MQKGPAMRHCSVSNSWQLAIMACLGLCLTIGCTPEAEPSPRRAEAPSDQPAATNEPPAAQDESATLALFERRIVPILESPRPSSCSECHLSSVDLKAYIHRDQARTFAALRDAGLIDVDRPDESKLLALIARKPDKPTLVGEQARKEEHDAFRAWIRAAAADPALLAAKIDRQPIGPTADLETIRHTRVDGVLASFIDGVWSEVGRCAGCHSPDRNREQVEKHGEYISWIRPGDPRGTLANLLESKLVDEQHPEQSKLLLKPTLQVEHGGGQKMAIGDRSYKQFRKFLDDYAAVAAGHYQKASDLPAQSTEFSTVSDIWFKLEGVPAALDKKVLQVDVFRADPAGPGGWSAARVAAADRPIFGGGQLWQQHLSLFAPAGSDLARELVEKPRLPAGKYLVRVYVDVAGKLQSQYPYELGPAEFVGELQLEVAWPTGYDAMTVARYPGQP